MSEVIHYFHTILYTIIEIAILAFEVIGLAVVIVAGIKGLISYLQRQPETKLILGEGFSTALSFLLGGELLRTVIVQNLSEIAIVAGIIVLRVALTILLHWEMGNEKKEHKKEKE